MGLTNTPFLCNLFCILICSVNVPSCVYFVKVIDAKDALILFSFINDKLKTNVKTLCIAVGKLTSHKHIHIYVQYTFYCDLKMASKLSFESNKQRKKNHRFI